MSGFSQDRLENINKKEVGSYPAQFVARLGYIRSISSLKIVDNICIYIYIYKRYSSIPVSPE